MEIEILNNEYWWGGVVDYGEQMPYGSQSRCSIDLASAGRDQRSALYLSNQGRYIWSPKPFEIQFDNGRIYIRSQYSVEFGDGYHTLKGAHQAVARKHFLSHGKTPDDVFFRTPQYNTWIELMYNQNQKQILEYAHAIVDNGMQPGILMIDEGWSEDYGVYDFYPGRFDNPKAMVEELHALGFIVMLWVTPHISPDGNAFRQLRDTDYLIREPNGEFAIRKWWNGYSCVLDLSHPGARAWFEDNLRHVMTTYGVDGFKFDAGDPFMYDQNDCTYNLQLPLDHTADYSAIASNYAFNELRAVWNMGGTPLVCRLQDKLHTWNDDGLNCVIPNTLVQGLLGYYYGCPDMIGGGNYASFQEGANFDEELYVRWLEASIMCPMVQFSVAPWRVLTEDNLRIVQKLSKFRKQYAPYIIELARNATCNFEPMVRPLDYEFPHCGYETEKTMFMLGDRYLIVPMLQRRKNERIVRLPPGMWRDQAGCDYAGNECHTLKYSIDTVYVFEKIRENLH